MMKKIRPVPEHKDKLGQIINEGTKVAVSRLNQLRICSVIKITPKMIRVVPVNDGYPSSGFQVFSHQTVVVDTKDVLSYILRGLPG